MLMMCIGVVIFVRSNTLGVWLDVVEHGLLNLSMRAAFGMWLGLAGFALAVTGRIREDFARQKSASGAPEKSAQAQQPVDYKFF